MIPQEEPIKEDIAIPAYGIVDPQEKRKIFESIFSIHIISKIRRDLITICLKNFKESNEKDLSLDRSKAATNESREKDENEALKSFFKDTGLSSLWENFIIVRNLLAHPYNDMKVLQFRSLITNVKKLIKFLRNKESDIVENLIKILRQILTKLESLNCLVNISIKIAAQQVTPRISLSPPSILIDWKLQPRKTPTNRVSEYLYVYRPSGQQIFKDDIVLYNGKEYVILCGKGREDKDDPLLLIYLYGDRSNELLVKASELKYLRKL